MKKIKCELHGISPIILHSCQCVNPLHPLTLKKGKITAKRKDKTEDDYKELSDLEFEAGLYWDDEIGVYIPAENIEATIREAAKAKRKGKDIVKGFLCETLRVPLDYGEKLTMEQLKDKTEYRDVRSMKVKTSRVFRTRPRFDTWNLSFIASYDEKILNFDDIVDAFDYAGHYVGLCDSRPRYGQFVSRLEELE